MCRRILQIVALLLFVASAALAQSQGTIGGNGGGGTSSIAGGGGGGSGTVTSVTGSAPIVITSTPTTTPNVTLTTPLAAQYGGSGITSPTIHDILIGNGSSPFTLVACSANQFLAGTLTDPACRLLLNSDLPTSAVTPGSYTCTNLTVNQQGIITAASNGSCSGGGSGTVTSVAMTVPTGFAVSGSPITTSGTLGLTLSNENANTVWAGPTSGSAAAPTFRAVGAYDVPGTNLPVTNEGVTGTVIHKLVKLTGAHTAILATTSDTAGIMGICIQGCGITGTAIVQQIGSASCVFDGATTADDYVQISPTTNGDCTDAGATYPINTGEVLGRVQSTNGSGGTYGIDLFSPDVVASNIPSTAQTVTVLNDAGTGTVTNKLAIYATQTGPQAVIASTGSTAPFIGLCKSGCGTSGSAIITVSAPTASCVFDGATTAGDTVVASGTSAGECHDTGGTLTAGAHNTTFGTVATTNGSGGTYTINNFNAFTRPGTIANWTVCDASTIDADAGDLFLASKGSGIVQFCNNITSINGAYTWVGQQSFALSTILTQAAAHYVSKVGSGPFPSLTACGTGTKDSIATDVSGSVTATGATSCTVVFGTNFGSKPDCWASDETTIAALRVQYGGTNNAGQITVDGLTSGDTFHYGCMSHTN